MMDAFYTLRDGDTPQSVARTVYGDVNKATVLLKSNPTVWKTGDYVSVPNRAGKSGQVLAGESPQQMIGRLFPNQPVHLYMARYTAWNGNEKEVGDAVFIPER